MTAVDHLRRVFVLGAVSAVFSMHSAGQGPGALTGEQILENVDSTFAGIEDYTVDLDATVDLDRLQVPPMHVTMYFKRPEKVHFESNGFAMLPREGLALSAQRLRSRYTIVGLKQEIFDSAAVQVLTLRAKTDKSRLREVLLYVDARRWTVARFVSPLAGSRTMTANFGYQQVQGHWLPATLVVAFASGPPDTTDLNAFDQMTPARRPQLPRNGTITIRYSNYLLNTGLSDEIFERSSPRTGKE